VKDGISAGDIKIRHTVEHIAEIFAVSDDLLHIVPCHGIYGFTVILRKYITMLAALVAIICYMPLEGKILLNICHIVPPYLNFLWDNNIRTLNL
jgi:hypothetical protein